MSVNSLDRFGVKHQYLYEIHLTIPYSAYVYLSSAGGGYIDTSGTPFQYTDIVKEDGDFPEDSESLITTTFEVLNTIPVIAHSLTPTTAEGIAVLARSFQFEKAGIAVYHQGQIGSGTPDISKRFDGTIEEWTIGTGVVVFEIEQRAEMWQKYAPKKKITAATFATSSQGEDIPQDTKGLDFPLAFGRAATYVPEELYAGGLTNDQVTGHLNRCGIKPRGFPCRAVRETDDEVHYLWSEHIDGGLREDTYAAGDLYFPWVYFSQVDAYARAYNHEANWSQGRLFDRGPRISMRRSPFLRMPLICDKVHSDSSGLTDGDKAIDGKSETYAALSAGGDGYWDIPSVPSLGRIVKNTNDNGGAVNDLEGTGKPAGIQTFVLLIAPPGSSIPSTGASVLYMAFPGSSNALFSNSATIDLPTSVGDTAVTRGAIRVARIDGSYARVGDWGDGWYGTKFDRFDFSAAHWVSGADGGDVPLSVSANGGNTGPFRIWVHNGESVPLYIVAVGIEVSFEWAEKSIGPDVRIINIEEVRNPVTGDVVLPGATVLDPVNTARGGRASPWGRGVGGGQRGSTVAAASDNLIVSAESYEDDGSGTYTGSADMLLETWSEVAHYLIDQYGDASSIITGASTHGSFRAAASTLDYWATVGNNGNSDVYRSITSITEQASVDDLAKSLRADHPGATITKNRSGQWGCYIWAPRTQLSQSLYRSGAALDPSDVIVLGPEGLQITTSGGSASAVVNQYRVSYDRDPGSGKYDRVATLNWVEDDTAFESDDGYGNNWPAMPGGVTCEDLAEYSKDHYGLSKEAKINLPNVIDRETALGVALAAFAQQWQPQRSIRFEGRTCFHDLETYQIIRFDNSLWTTHKLPLPWFGVQADTEDGGDWDQNWWRVVHIDPQTNPERTMLIEAEWIPTENIGGPLLAGKGGEPLTDDAILSL